MRNLSVRVDADIGSYTTNMTLASRIAREKMGESAGSVDDFQKSIMRASDELANAARAMGGNMQAANDAIVKSSEESAAAIEGISEAANEAEFTSLGEKVKAAMASGTAAAKTQWESFSEWFKEKATITGIAIGVLLAGTAVGAVYAAYKIVSGTLGFITGLFSGESYKSANIDALIAANKQVKELQESLRLTAQEATAVNAALAAMGANKPDYVSVFQGAEKAIRSNKDELDRLGVAYKDAKGNLLPLDQIIGNVNKTLNEYTEGWDRNQAASAIGIGTAAQVAAAVVVSSQKIDEARARLNDYNLGIGDESQAAITRYETAMRGFNRELELTSQGFKRAIADNIMPALTDLAEFFKDGFPFVVNVFRYSMAAVTSLLYGLKTSTYIVAESILGSIHSIGIGLDGLALASIRLLRGDFSGAKDALVQGWADAKNRIGLIGENIVAQSRHNAAAMRQAWALDDRAEGGGPKNIAQGKKWVPAPPAAAVAALQRDDVDKAILEAALKAQEAFIAAEEKQLQARSQFLQTYRAQEYINDRQFYTTEQQLIQDALDAKIDAYNKEIAALKVFRATRNDTTSRQPEKEKLETDNKIAEIEAKIAAARVDASNKLTASLLNLLGVQRQFNLQTIEWNRQQTIGNDSLEFSISMMGKSTLEVEKANVARRIQLDLEERIYQARKKDPGVDVSQAILDAQQQTIRAQELIEAQYTKQRDGWFGASEAIRKYGEYATNVGAQVEDALTNAFRSAEDAFVKFVQTGKVDFKSLMDSVVADLARMQFRKFMAPLGNALDEWIKGLFGTQAPAPVSDAVLSKATGAAALDPALVALSASTVTADAGMVTLSATIPAVDAALVTFAATIPTADAGLVTLAGAAEMAAAALATIGGSGVGGGDVGSIVDILLGDLDGFASGGSFRVGGSGGTDSQLVAFRASPNERVSIETPGQQGMSGEPSIVVDQSGWTFGSDVNQATLMQWGRVIKSETMRSVADATRRKGAYSKAVRG